MTSRFVQEPCKWRRNKAARTNWILSVAWSLSANGS